MFYKNDVILLVLCKCHRVAALRRTWSGRVLLYYSVTIIWSFLQLQLKPMSEIKLWKFQIFNYLYLNI